jgi:hypothetical protein
MLPRHLIGLQLILAAAIATTPLFAQQSPPTKRTQVYVDKYSEQLSPLKEVRFAYSGYFTRSTPSKGAVGKWESTGEFRVSDANESFHCTSATQLVGVTGKPDFVPQDLGVEESLVTPNTCLRVRIGPKNPALPTMVNAWVETTNRRKGDEWSNELSHHPLGVLLGYVPCNCKCKSLQDLARSASCQFLENQLFDSKRLTGFSAESGELVFRVLFDPLDRYSLKQIEVSRPAAKAETDDVGEPIRVTLTILEVRYAYSLPSFVRLKISREQKGGVISSSNLPRGVRLADNSKSRTIEPQTWDYYYEIDIYQERLQDDCFTLEHAIPDGATVVVDGDLHNVYEWQNGKVSALPVGRVED